jgi:hypothetical protein
MKGNQQKARFSSPKKHYPHLGMMVFVAKKLWAGHLGMISSGVTAEIMMKMFIQKTLAYHINNHDNGYC